MSGNHRHQRPLTSLEKQDSWLSGLLYHVIFFSDLYISQIDIRVNICYTITDEKNSGDYLIPRNVRWRVR